MRSVEPGGDAVPSPSRTEATDSISDAERELYGGRLRYDQSYVRHEGPLTRLGFGHMAAALPHMVGLVLRTGWEADRRALMGVVAAELAQGVSAGWGLVAVSGVLAQLFAYSPTVDKLRDALPSLMGLAVAAVATAMLSAWSTALSGRLEPQVERAVSARSYTAVTGVEVEATERPEVQRIPEAGKFGTDSARRTLRLSIGVGNVVSGMVAAVVVLAALQLDVEHDDPAPLHAEGYDLVVMRLMYPFLRDRGRVVHALGERLRDTGALVVITPLVENTPQERRGIALDEDEIDLVCAGWEVAERLDADGLAFLVLRGPCRTGTRAVEKRPTTGHALTGALAVVTDDAGRVLLGRSRRGMLELPGGKTTGPEDFAAAVRELAEETGLRADPADAHVVIDAGRRQPRHSASSSRRRERTSGSAAAASWRACCTPRSTG